MKIVDHAQATELFSSYWDEELDAASTEALEAHLHACVVCRREYAAFEQAVGRLASLPKAVAPSTFVQGVVRRIQKRSHGRFFSPRSLLDRVPYELFSLLMLGLILALYLILQMSQPGRIKLP